MNEKVTTEVLSENEDNYRRGLVSLHRNLRQETLCNVETFKATFDSLSEQSQQLYSVFCQLFDHLENIDSVLLDILDFAPEYDFKHHKINGYRSQVKVTQKCLTKLMALVRHITVNKDSYLFRRGHYIRELESYVMVLGQLRDLLNYTRKLIDHTPRGQLIPDETILDTNLGDEIQMEIDKIDQEWFYGRSLGFQYCDSLKKAFEVVHISLATYSHNYQAKSFSPYIKLAGSLVTSGQYVLNPEYRAQKVVEVSLSCDIEFCKAFWNLSETDLLHNIASLKLPACPVNYVFSIDTENLNMRSKSGADVLIPSPSAHIGQQKLQLRLISHAYRQGQEEIPGFLSHTRFSESDAIPVSKYLLIQCHGGGFVSQTSRTHEAYLRQWAMDLQVPFLCIDYSLAPQAPFPRALEETYYAYCWALKNAHLLGTTAEYVAVVGDSAGGNLLLATMLKAIEDNIRLPHGIVCIYTPVYIQYIPSPSRALSVMDALLPVGILTKCLEAYAGDHIEAYKLRDEGHSTSNTNQLNDVKPYFHNPSKSSHAPSQSNTVLPHTVNHEEEDEEIKSLLSAERTNSVSVANNNTSFLINQSESEKCIIDNQSESKIVNSSSQSEHKVINTAAPSNPANQTTESVQSNDVDVIRNHIRHRRSSHLMHSRSGSMPLAPKVQQQPLPSRHDKNRHFAQSPLYKFSRIRIRQNPYLSPLFASDDLLSKMPSTYLVGAHLDPCLDDSVMFAKKLDRLGVDVHLDAADDVPHGFLNFVMVGSECAQATELCKERVRQALRLPLPI